MRLTSILFRLGRRPQDPNNVPVKPSRLPFKLREIVSGKSSKVQEMTGLQELTVFFASMKAHDFNEQYCQKEINDLKTTHMDGIMKQREAKKLANTGAIKIGKDLHYLQMNRFLKRFPNPK